MNRLIITHANCVDGCCSCAILKEKYKENAKYLEVDYADADPAYPERYTKFISEVENIRDGEVIMADICLKKEIVDMFIAKNNEVTIIDHHATVKPIIDDLRILKENNPNIKLNIIFSDDNKESGAMLTWKYVNPQLSPPLLVTLVEDYDLWKFMYPETKPFHAKLLDNNKQPKDYSKEFFSDLLHNEEKLNILIKEGKGIYESYINLLNEYADKSEEVILDGKKGLMVNAPMKYRSDLGEIVNKRSGTFALIWEEQNDGIVSCSLRSQKGFNVKEMAEKMGGGGHENAAAFRMSNLSDFQTLVCPLSRPKRKM